MKIFKIISFHNSLIVNSNLFHKSIMADAYIFLKSTIRCLDSETTYVDHIIIWYGLLDHRVSTSLN